jgi:hypothetical protein
MTTTTPTVRATREPQGANGAQNSRPTGAPNGRHSRHGRSQANAPKTAIRLPSGARFIAVGGDRALGAGDIEVEATRCVDPAEMRTLERMLRAGRSNAECAQALGLKTGTVWARIKDHPALQAAQAEGARLNQAPAPGGAPMERRAGDAAREHGAGRVIYSAEDGIGTLEAVGTAGGGGAGTADGREASLEREAAHAAWEAEEWDDADARLSCRDCASLLGVGGGCGLFDD